jgi:hypothetical protein
MGSADKYAAEYYPKKCRHPAEPHAGENRPDDGACGRYSREVLAQKIKLIGGLKVETVSELVSGSFKVVAQI